MEIGIKIAQARRELGITQVELAEKMSVTRQTISRWESGSAFPDIEKVVSLSKILDVSCDYLLMEECQKENAISADYAEQEKTVDTSVTRLLSSLEGKRVRISFYSDEEDSDAQNAVCVVEGFESNWIRVAIQNKKGIRKKMIALSSILAFEILEEEEK